MGVTRYMQSHLEYYKIAPELSTSWKSDQTAGTNTFRIWPLVGSLLQLGQKKCFGNICSPLLWVQAPWEPFLGNESTQKLSWIKDRVNEKSAPILNDNSRLQIYTAFWVFVCLGPLFWVSGSLGQTQDEAQGGSPKAQLMAQSGRGCESFRLSTFWKWSLAGWLAGFCQLQGVITA